MTEPFSATAASRSLNGSNYVARLRGSVTCGLDGKLWRFTRKGRPVSPFLG